MSWDSRDYWLASWGCEGFESSEMFRSISQRFCWLTALMLLFSAYRGSQMLSSWLIPNDGPSSSHLPLHHRRRLWGSGEKICCSLNYFHYLELFVLDTPPPVNFVRKFPTRGRNLKPTRKEVRRISFSVHTVPIVARDLLKIFPDNRLSFIAKVSQCAASWTNRTIGTDELISGLWIERASKKRKNFFFEVDDGKHEKNYWFACTKGSRKKHK